MAVKNVHTEEVFFVDADYLVVATGAVPFMPAFENDDLPGVYTAAVVQKMMNNEMTHAGEKCVDGGGRKYRISDLLPVDAGRCHVKAIVEAMPQEGGFPVQANRVRRLAIPVMTSHILLKAIPNKARNGITGAVLPVVRILNRYRGTEKIIGGIDVINICTGLIPG